MSTTLAAADLEGGSDLQHRASKAKALRQDKWGRRLPLLPALIFTLILTQLPFVVTLILSFVNWNLMQPYKGITFYGFGNYVKAFTDPIFVQSVGNTLVLTVSAVLASAILGLFLALLLDRKFLGKGVARTLAITPFLVMPAAGSLVWKTLILDSGHGVLNWFVGLFGIGTIDWIGHLPMVTIVMVVVWQWTPFMMLIILAGLQSQTEDILEAARVDGAGAFQIFRFMTLPHLRQYLELAIILGTIYIIQTFDQVFLITVGGPGTQTTTLPYFIYLKAFRTTEVGYAAAAGVLVALGTMVISTFALKVATSLFKEGSSR